MLNVSRKELFVLFVCPVLIVLFCTDSNHPGLARFEVMEDTGNVVRTDVSSQRQKNSSHIGSD